MKEIIDYLKETYHPRALLVYGSYTRGDRDEYSDFDCMVIVDSKEKDHDDSVIGGVQLDCFIFTAEEAAAEDTDPFLTAFDSESQYNEYRLEQIDEFREEVAAWRRKARKVRSASSRKK